MERARRHAGGVALAMMSDGSYLLPEWLYPDESKGIRMTQTVQVFSYALAVILSGIVVLNLLRMRRVMNLDTGVYT